MSTNQQKNNNEEEVDLGTLFQIIAKGFSNLFHFIGRIFRGLFNLLIQVLLFLKKNSIKIGIATVVGLVIGFFLETNKPTTYQSEMLVQPNFKSARQLYSNINFYNDLVKQQDTIALKNIFSLSDEGASSLRSFEIESIVNENDIIEAYDELIFSIDTTAASSYDYSQFKESFTNYDYQVHQIKVVAEQNDVFTNLGKEIISSLEQNEYFKTVKQIYNNNTKSRDSLFKQNLTQIDSLRKVYNQVLLEEAKKATSGTNTNISLDGKTKQAKELELFEVNRRVSEELIDLAKERSEEFEVINVLSNFQEKGLEVKGITKNYIFLFGAGFAGIMIIILLVVKLNIFLENYQNNLRNV